MACTYIFYCAYALLIFTIKLNPVYGSARIELLMRYYNNTAGTQGDNTLCEPPGEDDTPCDPFFNFCLDHYLGNSNPDSCLYEQLISTEYVQANFIVFGSVINGGINNPIIIPLEKLENRVKLKVDILDYNSVGFLYTWVDQYHVFLFTEPTDPPQWTDVLAYGTRPNDKTSLEFSYTVHCDDQWFGPRCDVYCADSVMNNYICDLESGEKICRPGWTDPGTNCTVDINECLSNPCQYGFCQNKENSYRCVCYQGTNGTHCEDNVDECISSPCLNDGTCVDQLDGYVCKCRINYSGDHCELDRPKMGS